MELPVACGAQSSGWAKTASLGAGRQVMDGETRRFPQAQFARFVFNGRNGGGGLVMILPFTDQIL